MTQFQVTIHDTRGGVPPIVTIEDAPWIGAASERAWAAIPAAERHHYVIDIVPPALFDHKQRDERYDYVTCPECGHRVQSIDWYSPLGHAMKCSLPPHPSAVAQQQAQAVHS